MCKVCGIVAIFPFAAIAGLFGAIANAVLFGTEGRREVVVDQTVAIVVLVVALFGFFDDRACARSPHPAATNLCTCLAESAAFVSSVGGCFLASDASGEAGLGISVDAVTTFVDLAIAVVVKSVTIVHGRLSGPICVVVLFVRIVVTVLPFALFTRLLGSVADAMLFGARIGWEVVVDLAVAIVVESVTIVHGGLRRSIGGIVLGVFGLRAIFPAIFAIADLFFGTTADAVLLGAWGRCEVVVDFSVAIVIFSVAFFGCSDDCADACAPKSVAACLCACAARTGAGIRALQKCASCLVVGKTRTGGVFEARRFGRYIRLAGVGIADLCGGFVPAGGRGACAKHTSIAFGAVGILFAALLAWNSRGTSPQTEPKDHQEADG